MRLATPVLLTALALAACAGPAPTTPTPPSTPRPKGASPKPGESPVAPQPTATAAAVLPTLAPTSAPPPALVATLTGKVKVPVGLISDKGLGVISNNGGGYRLAAVDQVPINGATVRLLDAAGQPVLDGGKPLTATTGPDGTYAFTAALPARNLVLEVTLPEEKGVLTAIAPVALRGGTDVDLVASLTTAYILDRYVRPQADPIIVLEKLPADVEAVTRTRAGAALSAGDVASLRTLTPLALVTAVDALRARDTAFDAQLEVVKKLLVAAGLSDLGDGKPADQIGLRALTSVVATPDGTIYFTCRMDERVWTLDAAGKLKAAIGRGPGTGDRTIAGKAPTDVQLEETGGLAVAPDGALLIWERDRILRYDAQKQLSVVTEALPYLLGVIATPEGTYALNWGASKGAGGTANGGLWKVGTGTPTFVGELGVAGGLLGSTRRFTAAAAGHATVVFNTSDGPDVRDLDLATARPGAAKVVPHGSALTVDQQGGQWAFASGAFTAGSATVKADPAYAPADFPPAFRLPDGALLLAREGTLFRCDATGAKRLAGLGAPFTEGPADEIPLEDPENLAVDPAGALRIFDRATFKLWHVVPQGQARLIRDLPMGLKGDFPVLGEPGRTYKVQGFYPQHMAASADGATWVLDTWAPIVLRIDKDGTTQVGFCLHADEDPGQFFLNDFTLGADGTMVAMIEARAGGTVLERRVPGQAPERKALPFPGGTQPTRFAIAPDGTFVLGQVRHLMTWKWGDPAVDLLVDLATKPNEAWLNNFNVGNQRMIATADRHLYGNNGTAIWRYDLQALTIQPVIGEDGYLVKGGTVDTSTSGRIETPTFDAAGNLYFLDPGNRQVKRVAAADLPR